MEISAVLITKNAATTISLTLESLRGFDEVVVLDTGSTDHTMEVAKSFKNVKLFKTGFYGFGRAKNEAARLAKHDWIFSIDADEVLSDELFDAIKKQDLKRNTVYKFRRLNYYRNQLIKHSGWGKETVTRLYNRQYTRFNEKLVHESLDTSDCKVKSLKGGLLHYSYLSISDFSRKRDLYSELFSIEYKGKRKSSPFISIIKAIFAFFNTFFLQAGFLDGYRGLLIAVFNSHVTFTKYLKLFEANVDSNILIKSVLIGNGAPVHPEVVTKYIDGVTQSQLQDAVKNSTLTGIRELKGNLTILN